ncbi:hypothetical protein IWQ62_001877 [Dispira parvispora]|uniref:PIN domain-containing protein n=1 Tax=Dispira parvispora TaxID=1520584 RepID=A0A9W8ASK7_9FUNG|nr:hypothetical protein IWQ62_001877 [Dispira parvispora]
MPSPKSKDRSCLDLLRAATDLEEKISLLNGRCREADLLGALECVKSITQPLRESELHTIDIIDLVLDELNTIRQRLQDQFQTLLDKNVVVAVENSVDERLWKYVFHDHVELCRYHMRKHKESTEKSTPAVTSPWILWSMELQRTLNAAAGFYYTFISSVTAQHRIDLGRSGMMLTLADEPPYSPEQKLWVVCLHRCLVYLGDIERYRVYYDNETRRTSRNEISNGGHSLEFRIAPPVVNAALSPYHYAKCYYYQSIAAYRESGRPHAQLAILAAYSNDNLNVLYWYTQSLMLPYPSNNAWVNLQTYVKNCMVSTLGLNERIGTVAQRGGLSYVNLYHRFIALAILSDTRCVQESREIIDLLQMNTFDPVPLTKMVGNDHRDKFFQTMQKLVVVVMGRIWDITARIKLTGIDPALLSRLHRVRSELVRLLLHTAIWLLDALLVLADQASDGEVSPVQNKRNGDHLSGSILIKESHHTRYPFQMMVPLGLCLELYSNCHGIIEDTVTYTNETSTDTDYQGLMSILRTRLQTYLTHLLNQVPLTEGEKGQVLSADAAFKAWLPQDAIMLGTVFLHPFHCLLPMPKPDKLSQQWQVTHDKNSQSTPTGTPESSLLERAQWLCWLARLYRALCLGGSSRASTLITQRLQADTKSDPPVAPNRLSDIMAPSPKSSRTLLVQDPPSLKVSESKEVGNPRKNLSLDWDREIQDMDQSLRETFVTTTTRRPVRTLLVPDTDAWLTYLPAIRKQLYRWTSVTVIIPNSVVDHLVRLQTGTGQVCSRARDVLEFFDDTLRSSRSSVNIDYRTLQHNNHFPTEFPFTECFRYRLYFMKPAQVLKHWDRARALIVPTLKQPTQRLNDSGQISDQSMLNGGQSVNGRQRNSRSSIASPTNGVLDSPKEPSSSAQPYFQQHSRLNPGELDPQAAFNRLPSKYQLFLRSVLYIVQSKAPCVTSSGGGVKNQQCKVMVCSDHHALRLAQVCFEVEACSPAQFGL